MKARVLDPRYEEYIARLDTIPDKAIQADREARQEVLSAPLEDRRRIWIINRLLHPKFDEPNAQMPQMNMTRAQAETITTYLMEKPPPAPRSRIRRVLTSRAFFAGTALGGVAGLCLAFVGVAFVRRRSRRASS